MIAAVLLSPMLAASPGEGAVPLWATLALAVVPLAGAWLAYRQATKASKATKDVDTKKVDAEAYMVAKGFYEDMLTERKNESVLQQGQIVQLNEHVIELQKSLNEMQVLLNARLQTEDALRAEIATLGNNLTTEQVRSQQLTSRVVQLEALINAKVGMSLPGQPDTYILGRISET